LRLKFDGYRCIAVKLGKEITLFSRHQKVLNKGSPSVVEALASLGGDFVLDGEHVALDSHGRPSFQLLQTGVTKFLPIYVYALDLLDQNGELLVDLPRSRRRQALESLFSATKDPLRLSPLLQAPPTQVLEVVRASLDSKVSWANGSIPSTNRVSD
jgi:bifunctional non-homologous end joining protein LigD